jgi:hypothetical protein
MFPFFFGGRVLYWGDILLQSYPWRWFIQAMVSRGELPLWNPYIFCGMPFVANPQPATFYPLTWLLLTFPSEYAVTLEVALHLFLAGLFMHLYLRQIGRSETACWVGCLSFMLGGFVVTKLQFPPILRVLAWLPFVLWQVEKLTASNRGCNSTQLWLVFGLAMMWLGGHLQVALLGLVFYLAYALTITFSLHRDKPEQSHRSLWQGVVAPSLWMIGLTALQWLPALELMRMSTRTQLEVKNAFAFSLPPWQLLTLVIPNFFGSPQFGNYWGAGNDFEVCAYTGIVTLLLALVGASASKLNIPIGDRVRRGFWIGMVIIGLLLAMGGFSPIYRVLFEMTPILKMWRAPARFLLWYTISVSCLAALGWDTLCIMPHSSRQRWLRHFRWMALAFAVLFFSLLAGYIPLSKAFASFMRFCFSHTDKSAATEDIPSLATSLFASATVFTAICVLMFFLSYIALSSLAAEQSRMQIRQGMVIGVLLVDLFIFGAGFNPFCSASVFHTPPHQDINRSLARQYGGVKELTRVLLPLESINQLWSRYYNYGGFGGRDADFIRAPLRFAIPNFNMVQGIYQAEGYDAVRYLPFDRKLRAWEKALDPSCRPGGEVSVPVASVLISAAPAASRVSSPCVSLSAGALPRIFLTTSSPLKLEAVSHIVPVVKLKDRSNTVSLWLSSHPEFTQLVMMDVAYPGWRCLLDGRETALSLFEGVFRRVSLSPTAARVVMFYYPLSFRCGLFVSLVCLALWVGCMCAQGVRNSSP